MIILDTNIVSALMQSEPDNDLTNWLDRIPAESVWLTAISVFELRYGIEKLATGRRRRQLEDALARVVGVGLQNQILFLDDKAAEAAAVVAAERKRAGRPTELRDTLIAGIAISNRADVATRNVRHFADLDVRVIDPWAVR